MDTIDTSGDITQTWLGVLLGKIAPRPSHHRTFAVAQSDPQTQNGATPVELVGDVLAALDQGVALLDEEMRFVLYNEAYADRVFTADLTPKIGDCGIAHGRAMFASGAYILPQGKTAETLADDLTQAIRSYGMELELERTDGRIIRASSKRTALGGYLITASDVTARRQAEAAETARREAFSAAMESLEEGFALWDSEMRFITCNQRHVDIVVPYRERPFDVGTSAEATIREAYRSGIYALPDGQTEDDFVAEVSAWAQRFGEQREFSYKDGRIVVITSHRTALGGYLLTSLDVTEERNSEAKARAMLNDALETLEEGFALWDRDMGFLMSNQRFLDMLMPFLDGPLPVGSSVEDVVRQIYQAGIFALDEDLSEDELVTDIEAWVQDFGGPREYNGYDGRVVVITPKRTALGGVLVTVMDITEQRNSDARARDMLFDAFQALDEGLVLCDAEMNYVFGNDAWKRMMFEKFPNGVPEPGDSVVGNLIQHVKSGFYAIPEHQTEDEYIAWMMEGMSQYGKQVPVSSADGRHFVGSSHLTAFGGALLCVRDVTRQKVAEDELDQQREIAHQNEKLSALGELLAGVAHELNNPLSVVFGYSQMLQGKVKDPVLSERVDMICQSAERAAKIVRTFLAMARQRPTKIETCSVNEIVSTAMEVSSYSLKSNGTQVSVALSDEDPFVEGDFDQLAQVLSNLVVNAGYAVQELGNAGTLEVRTVFGPSHHVIEIRDNGHGIPDDIQSRVFEPFFTTKDVGEGTGIGLAFSHRIVESHGGALTLRSKVGQGTSFFVKLRAAAPEEQWDGWGGAPSTAKTVLVVDDEDGVAKLLADLLTDAGFVVTYTTKPREALKIAERQVFDAVLSDFKMPEMNGEVFYRALEIVSPQNAARTGFITGDSMSANVRAFFNSSRRPYIEKPIIRDELMELVHLAAEGF